MKKGSWMKIRADYWGLDFQLQTLNGNQLLHFLNVTAWAASWGLATVQSGHFRSRGIRPKTIERFVELGLIFQDEDDPDTFWFNHKIVKWDIKQKQGKDVPLSGRYTYIIQAAGGGPVKIGVSTNPGARLATLQTSHPEKLVLLGTLDGGHHERRLHKRFADFRLNGEWFHEDILTELQGEA